MMGICARGLLGLGLLLAASTTAMAQAVPGANSEPIEIVSDSLTVEQDRKVATFTGNVQALQGKMTLTAATLRVYYAEGQGSGGGGMGQGTSIKRIEAEGQVRLSNPTDTAQGDRGVYDVAAQKVTLEGNVVLTSGTNVVRGAALDMDLRTNVSTVRSAGQTPQGERVRARFQPEKQGN